MKRSETKKELSDMEQIDLEIADYEAAKEDKTFLESLKKNQYDPKNYKDAKPLFPNKNDASFDFQYAPLGINPNDYSHSDQLKNSLIYKQANKTGIFPFGGAKKTKVKKTRKRFKIKKNLQKKRKYTKKH